MVYLFKKDSDRRYAKQRRPIKVGDIEYESVKDAAKELGVSPTTICNRLREGASRDGTLYIYLKKK